MSTNIFYNSSFNLFSMAIGIMLMTVGGIQVQNFTQFPQEISSLNSLYFSLPALMVSSGCFMTLICLIYSRYISEDDLSYLYFGDTSGTSESKKLYYVLFAILFVIQWAVIISAGVAMNNGQAFQTQINGTLDNLFNSYIYGVKNETARLVQSNFKCCGTTGPDFWRLLKQDIPDSCCEGFKCYPPTIYKTGCTSAISSYFDANITQMLAFQIPPVAIFTIVSALLVLSTQSRRIGCFFGCGGYESL